MGLGQSPAVLVHSHAQQMCHPKVAVSEGSWDRRQLCLRVTIFEIASLSGVPPSREAEPGELLARRFARTPLVFCMLLSQYGSIECIKCLLLLH